MSFLLVDIHGIHGVSTSRIFALVRKPWRGLVSIVAAWTCVARSTSLALCETYLFHALRAYHGWRELQNISISTTCFAFDTLGHTNPIDSYSAWWYLCRTRMFDLQPASRKLPDQQFLTGWSFWCTILTMSYYASLLYYIILYCSTWDPMLLFFLELAGWIHLLYPRNSEAESYFTGDKGTHQ